MKMALQEVSILSAVIVLSMLWAGGTAQSDDCTNVVVSMSPCLNYISGNTTGPSAACCTQLGTVARSQPKCLCEVVNGGGSNLGLNIDLAQAQALPKACNVQTPPPSQCKVASPSGSTSPKKNSGGGSKTVQSSSVLFFIVFTVSYVSTFSSA